MNFTTHIMFGLLIGAIFFGHADIMLFIALGSAIPDIDREYGFLSKDAFRYRQIHRAFCHNIFFLGIVYLINPFVGIGAFLHTLLDAFTTAKDRGVEWLYPISRMVRKAMYDSAGKRLDLDPNKGIYMLQNDPLELTRKTEEDLRNYIPRPWRRTYGPAVSGGVLDQGIFAGSFLLTAVLLVLSLTGVKTFINISYWPGARNVFVPFFLGSLGILLILLTGEIKRRRELKGPSRIPENEYKFLYFFFIAITIAGLVSGIILNPDTLTSFFTIVPGLILGAMILIGTSFSVLKLYSWRGKKRMKNGEDPYLV